MQANERIGLNAAVATPASTYQHNNKRIVITRDTVEKIGNELTYWGRVKSNFRFLIANQSSLLITKDEMRRQVQEIEEWKNKCDRSPTGEIAITHAEMKRIYQYVGNKIAVLSPALAHIAAERNNQDIVDAAWIPAPFRFSALPIMDTLTCSTLLMMPRVIPIPQRWLTSSATTASSSWTHRFLTAVDARANSMVMRRFVFNWGNQSLNVMLGYYYRADTGDEKKLLASYIAATLASTLTSIKAANLKSIITSKSSFVKEFTPSAVGSAMAHVFNLLILRHKEITDGIEVKDADNGQTIGVSGTAGAIAVGCSLVNRLMLLAPCLAMPALIMSKLDQAGIFKRTIIPRTPTYVAACTFSLVSALPLMLSVFPHTLTVKGSMLGKEFRGYERVTFPIGK